MPAALMSQFMAARRIFAALQSTNLVGGKRHSLARVAAAPGWPNESRRAKPLKPARARPIGRSPPAGRSAEAPNIGRQHQRRAKMVGRPEDHPAGHATPEGPVQHMAEARSIRGIAPGDQHRRVGIRCEGATPQPARPRPSHAPESVRKVEGMEAREILNTAFARRRASFTRMRAVGMVLGKYLSEASRSEVYI